MVTDAVTGLIWLKNANCDGEKNYQVANEFAAGLATGTCGLTDGSSAGDWRLPTIEEWQTTVARAVALGCSDSGAGDPPSLTGTAGIACFSTEVSPVFSGVQGSNYWSSKPDATNLGFALRLNLRFGDTNDITKTNTAFVWSVRGGR